MSPSSPARYIYFYLVHAGLLFVACVAYLFYKHPENFDWSTWLSALVVLIWSVYNNPSFSKLLGYEIVRRYRQACMRRFAFFRVASLIALALALLWGGTMFRELWSRWSYVDTIKRVTLADDGRTLPYPTAVELATAFQAYPHRREVPFVVARMSRLLAFDDQTSNFNLFIAAFLKSIDQDKLLRRYGDRKSLERYEGSIDPVIYLSRLIVEAGRSSRASNEEALGLLRKYRSGDELAMLHVLIYEHELAEDKTKAADIRIKEFQRIQKGIDDLLAGLSSQTSPRNHVRVVTSHAFQEVLDHHAQLRRQLADTSKSADEAEAVTRLYSRILTLRSQIANTADVPWLEGPGKFTLYHYFAHKVGRRSNITQSVMTHLGELQDLHGTLDSRIFDVEAFKAFRNLDKWDDGTPLSSSFAGSAMHKKLVEWLKSGW